MGKRTGFGEHDVMVSLERELQNLMLPLPAGEVHTWWLLPAGLDSCGAIEEQSAQLLAQDELERAAKYRFAKDRHQFLLGRSSLRILAGGYLETSPADLRFAVNRFGKPSLPTDLADAPLHFNVSHSGGVLLLAFARHTEVGVDVEAIRPMSDIDRVANRCLSSNQFQSFRDGIYGDKQLAFFRFWTRKEALIKALGTGLSQPLTAFDVTIDPLKPPRLTRASTDFGNIKEWTLHELDAPAEYQAALAVRGTEHTLTSIVLPC